MSELACPWCETVNKSQSGTYSCSNCNIIAYGTGEMPGENDEVDVYDL